VVIFDSSPFEQEGNLIDLGYKLNENNQAHEYQQKPLRGLFETTNLPRILARPHRAVFGAPIDAGNKTITTCPLFIVLIPACRAPPPLDGCRARLSMSCANGFVPATRFPLRPAVGASTKPSSNKDAATIGCIQKPSVQKSYKGVKLALHSRITIKTR
jgi:hypothetical protein